MSNAVDPNFSPPEGVHVSTKAKILIVDNDGNDFELLKIASAIFISDNGSGIYYETGSQKGTTYSGLYSGRGSVRRAHLNMAGIRMVMGEELRVSNDLKKLLSKSLVYSDRKESAFGTVNLTRYPIQNLVIEANIKTGYDPLLDERYEFTCRFHKVLFRSDRIMWDNTDLIRSGPMDFIYSYPTVGAVAIPEADTNA